MKTADTTFTALLAAVHRARSRLNCEHLGVAVRTGQARLILSVPMLDGPETLTVRMCRLYDPDQLAGVIDEARPDHVTNALAVARTAATTADRRASLTAYLGAYESAYRVAASRGAFISVGLS